MYASIIFESKFNVLYTVLSFPENEAHKMD